MKNRLLAVLLSTAIVPCVGASTAYAATMNFIGAWSATTAYAAGAVVTYGNQTYYASAAGTNKVPSPSSTYWRLIGTNGMDYKGAWSPITSYQVGAVVSYGGQNFYSLQAANLNRAPDTQTAWWVLVGTNGNTVKSGAGLPASTAGVIGDFWIDTTGKVLYGPKTASGWPTVGTPIIGPQGAKGDAGPAGPTGLQGSAGATGAAGAQGATGPAGPAGTQGNTGPAGGQGATGPAGPAGAAGAQGVTGPAGPAGAQGNTGPGGGQGATGPAGPAGAAGAQGVTGPAGPAGAQGDTGPAGGQGATGLAGPAGAAGAQGVTGPAGPAGAQGDTGPAGGQGATGPAGPAGAAGAQGVTGPVGPAGAQGDTGPAGGQGATGAAGPAGAAGAQGATGPAGAAGEKGDTGAAGAQGATGPAGTPYPAVGSVGGTVSVNSATYVSATNSVSVSASIGSSGKAVLLISGTLNQNMSSETPCLIGYTVTQDGVTVSEASTSHSLLKYSYKTETLQAIYVTLASGLTPGVATFSTKYASLGGAYSCVWDETSLIVMPQ